MGRLFGGKQGGCLQIGPVGRLFIGEAAQADMFAVMSNGRPV